MSRQTKKLTARGVASLKTIGRHSDGGNLYLVLSKTGGGLSRRWVFMYSHGGKQREAGLGSAATVSLADARRKAATEAKKAADARKTFGQCAVAFFESKSKVWRSAKYRRQWFRSLKDHAAAIWDRPVADIDTERVRARGALAIVAARPSHGRAASRKSRSCVGLREGHEAALWRKPGVMEKQFGHDPAEAREALEAAFPGASIR
jgi:hypothetical protein